MSEVCALLTLLMVCPCRVYGKNEVTVLPVQLWVCNEAVFCQILQISLPLSLVISVCQSSSIVVILKFNFILILLQALAF